MKYNLSKIMLKAWKVYRKTKNISFAESILRKADSGGMTWIIKKQLQE